jgi:hypothetical protein
MQPPVTSPALQPRRFALDRGRFKRLEANQWLLGVTGWSDACLPVASPRRVMAVASGMRSYLRTTEQDRLPSAIQPGKPRRGGGLFVRLGKAHGLQTALGRLR